MPPDKVAPLYTDGSKTREYRKSPFVIQAAAHNTTECLNIIIRNGGKITEHGFVGLSRKKKNQVTSNAIGAAAFNGSVDVLKFLMGRNGNLLNINHPSSEVLDFNQKGPLVKEYTGFTPIMLAVAEGGQNIEAVKILLANNADTTILDTYGNNILHIAAQYQNNEAIDFLTQNT